MAIAWVLAAQAVLRSLWLRLLMLRLLELRLMLRLSLRRLLMLRLRELRLLMLRGLLGLLSLWRLALMLRLPLLVSAVSLVLVLISQCSAGSEPEKQA